MRLTIFIYCRFFWVVAHSYSSHFMNAFAGIGKPPIVCITCGWYQRNSTHLFKHSLSCLVHMLCLFYFITTPLITESQNRNAIFIHNAFIYFTVVSFLSYVNTMTTKAGKRSI